MPRRQTPPARPEPEAGPLVAALLPWFATHARDLPWRHTTDPYAVWISEIMLQQTQVKTVIPYWERWLRELPNVAALAAAPEERVLKLWEGLGYYTRVRNLQRAARLIVARPDGRFPRDFDAVLALPGIGRYTAGAIVSIAFNQPAPLLDGNVIRVLTRLHALTGDPKEKRLNARLWELAAQLVEAAASIRPSAFSVPHSSGPCSTLNQSLMELGATLCSPRGPQCPRCPVARLCRANQLGHPENFPVPTARPAITARRYRVAVLERRGRYLIRQRPLGVVNAGLWEFPNDEVGPDDRPDPAALAAWLKVPTSTLTPLPAVKHSITRYRIHLDVFHAKAGSRRLAVETGARWVSPAELDALTLTSAHRRIARQFGPRHPSGLPIS